MNRDREIDDITFFLFLYSTSGWSGAVEYNRGIDIDDIIFVFYIQHLVEEVQQHSQVSNHQIYEAWMMPERYLWQWCSNNNCDRKAKKFNIKHEWCLDYMEEKAWSAYNAERPKIKIHLQMNWPLDLFSTSSHQSYSIFYLLSYCPCILLQ